MTIEGNRTLGGVGACLMLVGAVSSVLTVVQYFYPTLTTTNLAITTVSGIVGSLNFVGFILFLVAMYGFSKDYAERRIFSNVLYGIIIAIIVAIIAVVVVFIFLFASC